MRNATATEQFSATAMEKFLTATEIFSGNGDGKIFTSPLPMVLSKFFRRRCQTFFRRRRPMLSESAPTIGDARISVAAEALASLGQG